MRPFGHSEAGPERGDWVAHISWWMRNVLTNATVEVATHSPTVAARHSSWGGESPMSAIIRAFALFILVWIPIPAVSGWMATAGLISASVAGLVSSVWFLAALAVAASLYRRGALQ